MNEQNRLDQNYFNESQLDYNRFSDNRSYYSNLYNAALDWATNDANADYSNRFNEYQQRVSEDQWAKNYQLEKDQLAASKAANDQSAELANLNYYKANYEIGNGIEPVTRGGRGNTGNGGYKVLGETYSTRGKAEEALAKYLDKMGLSEAQINAIYDRLGM